MESLEQIINNKKSELLKKRKEIENNRVKYLSSIQFSDKEIISINKSISDFNEKVEKLFNDQLDNMINYQKSNEKLWSLQDLTFNTEEIQYLDKYISFHFHIQSLEFDEITGYNYNGDTVSCTYSDNFEVINSYNSSLPNSFILNTENFNGSTERTIKVYTSPQEFKKILKSDMDFFFQNYETILIDIRNILVENIIEENLI